VKKGGKIMKRHFLVLTLLLTSLTLRVKAQNTPIAIGVEATVDKVTLPMGDQAILHLTAHIQVKGDITFPQMPDSVGKLQFVKSEKPDTSFDKNNPQAETITRNYKVTSFTPGTYYIPALKFSSKTGVYTTDSLMLQFTPVAVDTTKGIYDIKQPMAVSYTWLDWLKANWPWIAIPLLIILVVIGFIYYWSKRPKKEIIVKPVIADIPPHVIAINKLNELRDKKLWQQNEVKLYHSELSDTLREYLEKRYRIHALEQTSDEIISGLKYMKIAPEDSNKLQQILVMADLVKFAKENPLPADNEQSMDNAISFILQTKEEPVAPVTKEESPK
jgi:hypothetical protein